MKTKKCSHCGIDLKNEISDDDLGFFLRDKFIGDLTLEAAQRLFDQTGGKIERDSSILKIDKGAPCESRDHCSIRLN